MRDTWTCSACTTKLSDLRNTYKAYFNCQSQIHESRSVQAYNETGSRVKMGARWIQWSLGNDAIRLLSLENVYERGLRRFERHWVLVHLRDARHWQAAAALASLELYNDYLGPISETTRRLHNAVFYLSGGGPEENSCAVWVCVHSRNSQDSEL